jgi:hypothetical protein
MKRRTSIATATAAALLAPLGAQGQTFTEQQLRDFWFYDAQKTYDASTWWDNRYYVTPFVGSVITDHTRNANNGWKSE